MSYYTPSGLPLAQTRGLASQISQEFAAIANAFDSVSVSAMAFRNLIINGDFKVSQRGITSQTTTGYGVADRWYCQITGSAATVTVVEDTSVHIAGSNSYFLRYNVTGAGTLTNHQAVLKHRIERCTTREGEAVTLSFSLRTTTGKSFAVELVQNPGTGGGTVITGLGATKLTYTGSGTTWQDFSVTVTLPIVASTIGTAGDDRLEVNFFFSAGSDYNARTGSLGLQTGSFDLRDIQLEPGAVSTTFERIPLDVSRWRCRRFYQRIAGNGKAEEPIACGVVSGATTARIPILYPVEMRTTPTVGFASAATDYLLVAGTGGFLVSAFLFYGISKTGCIAQASSSGMTVGNAAFLSAYTSTVAAITLDAEL